MWGEYLRQVLYAITLALMVVVLWVANWSNQLEARVERGWVAPLPMPHVVGVEQGSVDPD